MANEIKISDANLVSVIEERGLGDLLKPLVKEIHLFDTYIAGTSFIEDSTVFESLQQGNDLTLRREPDNKFDPLAIMVLTIDGDKLGYVPRKDNLIFGRLLEAGKLLKGKISDIEKKNSYYKIKIGIYLVDY